MFKRRGHEDFCQALGIVSETKYQKEDGPLLKQCFALLREVSSAPVLDLARLLDAVIFNFLVGNNDAHGKNFSLLCRGAGTVSLETRLAPLYDVVSTRYYPELARELAMKIGAKYSPDRESKANFEQLAEDAGLAKPLVRSRVPGLAEAVLSNLDKTGIEHPVVDTLTVQIWNTREARGGWARPPRLPISEILWYLLNDLPPATCVCGLCARQQAANTEPGSVCPFFMANRQLVEMIPPKPPVRHELIHQRDKSGVVGRLGQVRHFVHHDVFEAFLGLLGQFRIEADGSGAGIAASPLGLHLLHMETRNRNAENRRPYRDHCRNRRLQLASIPQGDDLLLLLLGRLWAYLITQDFEQFYAAYGQNETIVSNCHVRIVYPGRQGW
jgi:hypothetical protein